MEYFLCRFVLPLILLTASLIDWSLISLGYLIAFLVIQFNVIRGDFRSRRNFLFLWGISIFSLLAAVIQAIIIIIWAIKSGDWSLIDSSWVKLIGFMGWRSSTVIFSFILQLLVGLICLAVLYKHKLGLVPSRVSSWGDLSSILVQLGLYLKVVSCFSFPAIQLVVGISRPSWVSLPFFICSCVGLVDWSLTSNFSGLFRFWRPLQFYAGFNILLLYAYQLPVGLSAFIKQIAKFVGLYKISAESRWLEICSSLSLIGFYTFLSFIKKDLEEMEFMMTESENDLTEQLLPTRRSFFIRQSRSGERHTNVLVRGAVFRTFTINFFTYGFPLSLFALCFWSFYFACICAFGLLAYVGYVVYAFPSLVRLHRLNGLLLVFILLWAVSTYIFNVGFSIVNWNLEKDMEIWELLGLWRYSSPGYFLLAQFGLGVLVAVGNLVNNSVFAYTSNANDPIQNGDFAIEATEETKVLAVATIAWGLRKCSRAIVLLLLFLIAMKPGFVHAIYMIFFLLYLLGHNISKKMRKALILLCEAHFALSYIFQIDIISKNLEHKGSLALEILTQLGLLDRDSSWDFMETAVLACFCAVHNHGFDMLFSFSAVVQHTPFHPVGFSVLKAGLNKSVLLSVYSSSSSEDDRNGASHERRVASYLSAVGQKFLALYRSWGTYVTYLTILVAVYLVRPNYISFGYVFLLLFWIIGRQLIGRTKMRLWFPLKVYAIVVFIFMYTLSIFPSFLAWLSSVIDPYPNIGFKPEASLLENVLESLAILIVMQLYSYERRQSKYNASNESDTLQPRVLGFIKRFLIWHSNKVLYIALFYASISPISAFGLLYLLGLIIYSTFPKTSRTPSKSFLVYTSFIIVVEYLFQMWGQLAKMFPGQKHAELSHFLGLRVFESGFWGIESSLRGEVLVIAACTLQYNVFHWLDRMPSADATKGEWEEPCPLFVSTESEAMVSSDDEENKSESHPTLSDNHRRVSESIRIKKSFRYFRGSMKESQRWNKRRIMALRNERFDMQKTTLKVYLMFWIENMFNLFGLEINMIVLLLASFVFLNVISLLYIGLLASFILLNRRIIHKLWPILVFLFACVLILEYFAIWKNQFSLILGSQSESNLRCHDCWSSSKLHFQYCEFCWLGLIVDDPRMLMSYFIVFVVSCFKLRADKSPSLSGSFTYHQMMSQRKNIFVWKDLSFETKSMWTIFDYLRLYCYCHLLDLVLTLILVTGTLEYDILHLGYLGFALVFFRMRLEILHKRNKIFKFLRMYNFVIIVLSLAYQSPFIGVFNEGKCGTVGYIYEVIGFYKYDYGFRITSRSALVEIIIFILVSVQFYMFSSSEFEHVSRYLEAEQIGAVVREQEKKAAWKTAQLQHIRESEEKKLQRNMQVEKMKSEMLDLQVQLHSLNSPRNADQVSPGTGGLWRRKSASFNLERDIRASLTFSLERDINEADKDDKMLREVQKTTGDLIMPSEYLGSPISIKSGSPTVQGSPCDRSQEFYFGEITEVEEDVTHSVNEGEMESSKGHSKEKMLREVQKTTGNLIMPSEYLGSPISIKSGSPTVQGSPWDHSQEFSFGEITEVEEDVTHSVNEGDMESSKGHSKEHLLKSAVQLIGDGVSQVQTLGNQAVTNLASLLNVAPEDGDSNDHSSGEDQLCDEMESQNVQIDHIARTSSFQSDKSRTTYESVRLQLTRILQHIWSQMRSNNDIVCYCCFILIFLWDFSLLSMTYLAALFLYALCVNTGPSYTFWVAMLIYTELYILVEYLYQIIIQHCGLIIKIPFLQDLGFPAQKIKSSFVISSLPLFVVYLFILLQSSITAQDGELGAFSEFNVFKKKMHDENCVRPFSNWREKLSKRVQLSKHFVFTIMRSCLRYWKTLTQGAESPPYFVQLSMDVGLWPEDGIQPEKIESRLNQFLKVVHSEHCKEENPNVCPSASRVSIQSIEKSEENPNVALAVFEVVHASPMTECIPEKWSKSLTPAADVAKEILIAKRSGFVEEVGFPYPIISVIGGGKREVDLYAYTFVADLAVFFLVAICYQSVIKNKSEFLDVYQLEDQFPKEFVFILMAIFFLIVVDRIIYLCSFATWKVLFYIFNLVLFTYSVTQYAWNMQSSQQYAGILALRAIFLTKAASLVIQAMQIRYGMAYKSALYRQFLTSSVSRTNYLGYRLYRALPFLYELRCVLDWSCTTTSLTMYDWLKLEDINASLFLVKCDTILNRATHKQGDKQTKMTKLCNGICLFFILIIVIWAPMLMYSSGNPTNIANPIKDASVQVDIKSNSGRLTLYQTTLCDKLNWAEVKEKRQLDPEGFLTAYDENDIQLICCQADASILWLVPEVVQKRFSKSLDVEMNIIFSWVFTRDRPKGKEAVKYERIVYDKSDLPRKSEVQAVLNGDMKSFRVHKLYPRYFRVTGSGDVRPFESEVNVVSADLSINRQNSEWWSFYDINPLNSTACEVLTGPTAIVVSEETPQGILGDTLNKFSIWGLYITFVLAVGRFIRLQCSDLRMRIPYENLPSCDRLIAICEDIYAARAEGELGVEEVLYWTLVKIYRSPHMLLEYTKHD